MQLIYLLSSLTVNFIIIYSFIIYLFLYKFNTGQLSPSYLFLFIDLYVYIHLSKY